MADESKACEHCGRSRATHLDAAEALVEDRKRPRSLWRERIPVCTHCGLSAMERAAGAGPGGAD